jgi:hypothetical protein
MAPSGTGGGIYGRIIYLTNSTITGNSASNNGGGVYNVGGGPRSPRARNTIIALNSAPNGPDMYGVLNSENFNLIGNSAGATISGAQFSDQIGTPGSPIDPLLGDLADNGGPTFTHALLSSSTAIDRGHSSGSTTDQRGFTRPVGAVNATDGDGGDIGAFEFGSSLPTPTPTPTPPPTPTPTPTPEPTPTPTPSSLGNISTRLRVQGGDNVLIGGMIVTGSAEKKVIIRAVGPTLTDFGVPGALADPTLELHQGDTVLASNDDWRDSPQQAEIAASGFVPNKDAESAIIATLTPGQNYTAIVRGKNDTAGIGVVEAFDLDQGAASKLGNISTRGFVDVGDNVMIAGLIVSPSDGSSLKVLVRALGPTLGDFGVPGVLGNPTLDLVDSSGTLIRSNDNWKDSQRPEIEAAQLSPNHDEESALVETLAPGAYTAIVRGSGQTTGVGLVEVYNIP